MHTELIHITTKQPAARPVSEAKRWRGTTPSNGSGRRGRLQVSGSGQRAEYERLRHRVYQHYGAGRAERTADACMRSCSHLILVRAACGTLVAGMRIHQRTLGPLPVEAALPRSRMLHDLLEAMPNVAELSGAVVCFRARKLGLGAALMRTGVAALPLLGCRSAVGLGHQHVLPLYAQFGMMTDSRFPAFDYPDSRYQSRVIMLKDALALAGVEPVERGRIRALRRGWLNRGASAHSACCARGGRR